jgi:hypothetical protein
MGFVPTNVLPPRPRLVQVSRVETACEGPEQFQDVSFSDALTAERRRLWPGWVLARAEDSKAIEIIPAPLRELVFSSLAGAA